MKRYERPVVIVSYSTRELREEAAAVVAASMRMDKDGQYYTGQ